VPRDARAGSPMIRGSSFTFVHPARNGPRRDWPTDLETTVLWSFGRAESDKFLETFGLEIIEILMG